MTHIVKLGETLSGIARKYGTTVEALVVENGIKNKNIIWPGQVLRIPEKTPAKDYAAIGKQVEKLMADIEGLASYKALEKML